MVAHPDDELLGIGASINKLIKQENCRARAVILGEGLTSRSKERDLKSWDNELKNHRENIEKARIKIGYESVGIYNFPDNRFDSIPILDIIKVIEEEKSSYLPDVIFTHHFKDLNVDHKLTAEAVITATRPIAQETVRMVAAFETLSATEWNFLNRNSAFFPNLFISIDEGSLNAKLEGLRCYDSEIREYPHPRSIEGLKILAQSRGLMISKLFAEAFEIIRIIE